MMKQNMLMAFAVLGLLGKGWAAEEAPDLLARLTQSPFQLVYETYRDNNWELAVVKADGTEQRLLTHTPDVHELYPQVSPDGTKICLVIDEGEGRDTQRSVWVMNIDGSGRKKVADQARQPFWTPDGSGVCFLPQEYPRFRVADYFTTGLRFYDLESAEIKSHPHSDGLHHLYNPHFAPNGKWIVATVHAGMDFGHTNILVQAQGNRVINLGQRAPAALSKGEKLEFGGCRPCISPDSKKIAWGRTDHDVCVAELDLHSKEPYVGKLLTTIHDPKHKIYHVDWSPDGQFLSLSRGLSSEGDLTKPGTHQAACEMVGIYAKGWDLIAVPAVGFERIELLNASGKQLHALTSDGASNKESDWFHPVAAR